MSRINRAPIQNGDAITAANLNARYSDYTQTDLNQYNAAEASIDLPQFDVDWQCPYIEEITLGEVDLDHDTPNSVASATATPVAGSIVSDKSATPTIFDFGLAGLSVTTSDILRLYWSLSVHPVYSGTPWTSGTLSNYTMLDTDGISPITVATSQDVWVLYPEWDITSNSLSNWEEVPRQTDFGTGVTAQLDGGPISECMATTVIPAWLEYAEQADGGEVHGLVQTNVGWRGVSGCFWYPGSNGAVTVYGIRWRIKGILHPYNTGNVNYLVIDTDMGDTTQKLEYTSGTAQVILHRVK